MVVVVVVVTSRMEDEGDMVKRRHRATVDSSWLPIAELALMTPIIVYKLRKRMIETNSWKIAVSVKTHARTQCYRLMQNLTKCGQTSGES